MVDWDGIIDREGPAVWRTVCRLLTHRADAEECFQETFLAALEASSDRTFKPGKRGRKPKSALSP